MHNPKNNRKYNLEFQIVSEENKPVLGASAIQGMDLTTVHVNMQNILTFDGLIGGETQGLTVSQVVTQFKDVFECVPSRGSLCTTGSTSSLQTTCCAEGEISGRT